VPRRQKTAIAVLLFLAALIALGDRYFPVLTKQTLTGDEPPVFGFLQILIPGGMEQLGRFCNAPETIQNAWSKKYYCDIKLTDRYLAFFTFWLAVATIGLGAVSVAGIRGQSKETRILQRAYLSANIGGISPFRTIEERDAHIVVGHVDFINAGHLPARSVSCCVKIIQNENGEFADFPIADQDFFGNYVLPPGAVMRQGSDSITLTATGYIYVWGRIKYLDGFGNQRTTDFCHRYPRIMLRRLDGGYGIPTEFGRYHTVGNSTDED
jgi:hypothetical protein